MAKVQNFHKYFGKYCPKNINRSLPSMNSKYSPKNINRSLPPMNSKYSPKNNLLIEVYPQ